MCELSQFANAPLPLGFLTQILLTQMFCNNLKVKSLLCINPAAPSRLGVRGLQCGVLGPLYIQCRDLRQGVLSLVGRPGK